MKSDKLLLEEGRCIFCEIQQHEVIHDFSPFRVVRCGICGLAFLSPRLKESELRKIYDSEAYFSTYSGPNLAYTEQEKSLFLTYLSLVKILKKEGVLEDVESLLEIGCGPGLFLKAISGEVDHSIGVDLSEFARSRAKAYCEESYATIYELPPGKSFDLIVALNLIEHLYDPVSFLRDCATRLIRGGFVFLATPKFDGFWYKILRKRWPSFKIPEHVYFYTSKTIRRLLLASGFFEVKRVFSVSHAYSAGFLIRKACLSFPGPLVNLLSRLQIWIPDVLLCVIGRRL